MNLRTKVLERENNFGRNYNKPNPKHKGKIILSGMSYQPEKFPGIKIATLFIKSMVACFD